MTNTEIVVIAGSGVLVLVGAAIAISAYSKVAEANAAAAQAAADQAAADAEAQATDDLEEYATYLDATQQNCWDNAIAQAESLWDSKSGWYRAWHNGNSKKEEWAQQFYEDCLAAANIT